MKHKSIITDLKSTTTHIYTRKYGCSLTAQQIETHNRGLETQDKLHNFTLRYLEKTYGRKHLDRNIPKGEARHYLVNKIKDMFRTEQYERLKCKKKQWNAAVLGLSSQSANAFIENLIAQFTKHQKAIRKSQHWPKKRKDQYRKEKNREWFRHHAIGYRKESRTITVQGNNSVEVISDHHIKIPDFGVIRVRENIKNLKSRKISIIRIKKNKNNTYDFQIVFQDQHERQEIDINNDKEYAGYDWGMLNNEIWHGTDGSIIALDPEVVEKSNAYEKRINEYNNLLQTPMSAANRETILKKRQRAFAKRTNLLNEEYKRHARLLFDNNTMIVIEDLNSNSMRDESEKKTKQSKGLNKKLATVKPATMRDFIIQRANKTGKTVVLVNPKFTSQIEFGVLHEPKKIPLDVREWISEFTGRLIARDYNAAWNILFWGLYPMFHYLALKGESVKTLSRTN